MNRRSILFSLLVASPALAAIAKGGSGASEPTEPSITAIVDGLPLPCDPENASHGWMVEQLGRELMAETGDWKQYLWDSRSGKVPVVVTRSGCCCCEITLRAGQRNPDWTYTVRPMTESERRTFQEEYGKNAHLLLNAPVGGRYIRGFVLNGRTIGWNISAGKVSETIHIHVSPDDKQFANAVMRVVRNDMKSSGLISEVIKEMA